MAKAGKSYGDIAERVGYHEAFIRKLRVRESESFPPVVRRVGKKLFFDSARTRTYIRNRTWR